MLIDSHCHLNYKGLVEDRAGVLARARAAGVQGEGTQKLRQRSVLLRLIRKRKFRRTITVMFTDIKDFTHPEVKKQAPPRSQRQSHDSGDRPAYARPMLSGHEDVQPAFGNRDLSKHDRLHDDCTLI